MQGYVLFLLSDGLGVKRLIIMKPVGLPGTYRYFPYNIRELDRGHCEDYLSLENPSRRMKSTLSVYEEGKWKDVWHMVP